MNVMKMIVLNLQEYDVSHVSFIVESCIANPDLTRKIGTRRLFDLCESLITNERFSEFQDLILRIVSLDPEMFYLGDCTGYNLFMMALDYSYTIDSKDLIEFIKSLERLLYNYRVDRLVNHQDLRIIGWDVENTVSKTMIPAGEEEEHDNDQKTPLSLALETNSAEIVEKC
jgi:hypothetical protein